jgi:hypothetical protein
MGFKDRLKRIIRGQREGLESFVLLDGSTYYYDREQTAREMFVYSLDVELGRADDWEEPPEIFRKMCDARDLARVLKRFMPKNPQNAFVDPAMLFDLDALVEERQLVPIEYEAPEDLSEP